MQKYAGVNEKGQSMWYVDKKDTNGNIYTTTTTAYTEASKYKCETALPKGYGGFGTSIYFKGIDFSISFDYQIGGLVYDSGYANLMSPFSDKTGTARHKDLLMAWSPERTSSNIPRFQYLDQNVASTSDRFLIDASYLNLGNINLGYTFPAKLTNKIKLNTVRMYCVAENIKYWSKRKGLDPRQNFNGSTTYVAYSPIRTISGGLQITF